MNAFEHIHTTLETLAGRAGYTLETPADIRHGDYATNIALVLAKERRVAPNALAEEFVRDLQVSLSSYVEKIVVAGPGFINFFLTQRALQEMNQGRDVTVSLRHKNVLVEHSSPNLFKPFHIGHLMNNIVGEFVARAVKRGGAETQTLCFPSDISFGIAKAVYVWKKDRDEGVTSSVLSMDEKEAVEYFGTCYVRGVALAKENPELEREIRDVAKKLFDEIDGGVRIGSEEYDLWSQAKVINTKYFSHVLESIGSHMGKTIFESEVSSVGLSLVRENIGKVFTESEGAVVYIPNEERKDINVSVFINSEGHPTYEAKDLGLIYKKFSEYKGEKGQVDLSYFITDNEQSHHFKVVLDAGSKINNEWKTWTQRSIHVPHGRMLFKGQKMSSRLGGVPLALDVIGVIEEEVRERSSDKIAHLSEEEKAKLVRDVALSALRVAVLRSKPGLNINFDPEVSLSFEGDSGPYLMYTHARASSVFDKGLSQGISPLYKEGNSREFERVLIHYEEVLTEVIETLAPQKLVSYLFSVAQAFNSYYASQQILVEDDDVGNAHRLAVVKRVKHILKDGLSILGCSAPERM